MIKSKTTITKGNSVKRNWHLVDLSGKTLGRVSVEIANLLMGKNKPSFSFQRDDGDYVVCINAKDIVVTGNKLVEKINYHYTGYAGHLKELTLGDLMKKDPALAIIHSVRGMLPKNKLRDKRITRLKVSAGSEHQYSDKFAQK